VVVPSSEPSTETGQLRGRGLRFDHSKAARLLAKYGGSEVLEIDMRYRCGRSSTGDIDFAARLRTGRLLVAEVKTRLIPKEATGNMERLVLMLQYHLDEPGDALRAWERLVSLGVVRPPPGCGTMRGYDNPASIAELVREAAGAVVLELAEPREVLVGAVLLCTVNGLLQRVEGFVANTARYLSRLGIGDGRYAVLVIGPDNFDEPRSYWASCSGPACPELADEWPQKLSREEGYGGCYNYLGCSNCAYRRRCMRLCRSV